MSTFHPSLLEEIRNRLPLSGIVGARVRMVRAGREFKGCCPFHNEKTPSFYVNDDKQFFHCFGCGAHGDVIGFTMRHDRLSFPEAVENLAAQAGLQVPRDTPVEREKFDAEKRLYQLLDRANAWFEEQLFAPAGREALAYLRKRGLSDEAIHRFRLGYAPTDAQGLLRKMTSENYTLEDLAIVGLAKKSEDRNEFYSFFRNRVIFPVGDRRGRTVAFGARILGEGEPKYLNSPDHALFHKGQLLYGLSRARTALSQGQPIIVVEGYMDVIALVEAGYSGAVAPLGTALTDDQIQILWKLLPPPENREASRDYSPILCFDGDNAGLRAATRAVERALPLLTPTQTLRILTIKGAKDPDELIRQQKGNLAFDFLLKQARPVIDFLWESALAGRQEVRTPEEIGIFRLVLKRYTDQIQDKKYSKSCHYYFNDRIYQTFMRKGKGATQNAGSPPPPTQDKHWAREKILLAFIINHPDLFNEFGESFAFLEFHTPEFEALRQNVSDLLSQAHDAPITSSELRHALSSPEVSPFTHNEVGAVLNKILSPDTYFGVAKAAHPNATPEETRQAWLALLKEIEQEKVRIEYAKVCALYRDQPTEDNQRRMEALRERVMQLAGAVE
jgi:DNA primase